MTAIDHSPDNRIVTVTLDRPEKRNALSADLVQELTHVFSDLAVDERVRAVILAARGPVFSAGADLSALQALRSSTLEDNLQDSRLLAGLFTAIRTAPFPVIARVHGHAIAGGCGLVAAADIAIAAREARFGFTEVRIGFVPALVSVLLDGRVLHTHQRDLFLTGRLIGADEAVRMGLIARVANPADLDQVVERVAGEISRNTSRSAIARTKAMLLGDPDAFRDKMEVAAVRNADARRDPECLAGVDAFLNRHDAPWVREWDEDHTEPA